MSNLGYNGIISDWYACARSDCLHLFPNDYLVWNVLKWGSKNDFVKFDFGGAGKPTEKFGVREFKRRFGGQLVDYGRYENVHSKFKMFIAEKGFPIYKKINLS